MKGLILFIFLSTSIFGQQIGFSLDGTGIITGGTSRIAPVPTGISFFAGTNIFDKFNAEIKVGYQIAMIEYAGVDYHAAFSYHFNNPFYIMTTIGGHSNSGSSSEGVKMEEVTLLGIGGGIDITSFMSFELIYQKPLTKEIWLVWHNYDRSKYYASYLTDVFRGYLKFYFNL